MSGVGDGSIWGDSVKFVPPRSRSDTLHNDGCAYEVGDGGDDGCNKSYARKAGGDKSYPREVGNGGVGGRSKSFAHEVGDGDSYSREIGEGGVEDYSCSYTSGVGDGAGCGINHVTPRPRRKRTSRKICQALCGTDSSGSAKESDDSYA